MKIEFNCAMPVTKHGFLFIFARYFFVRACQRNAMSFTTNYDPVTANFNLCKRARNAHHRIADLFAFSVLSFIPPFSIYPTIFNYANIHPLYLNYHFSLSFCELLNRSLHFVSSTIFTVSSFVSLPPTHAPCSCVGCMIKSRSISCAQQRITTNANVSRKMMYALFGFTQFHLDSFCCHSFVVVFVVFSSFLPVFVSFYCSMKCSTNTFEVLIYLFCI